MATARFFYSMMRLAGLAFLLTGCGVFETRTPEPPDEGGGSAGFQQPDRPEQVIENLQNAVSDMNSLNYMRNLLESEAGGASFSFTPSSAALDNDPSVWQNWSREDEATYFNNLVTATQNQSGHRLVIADLERITLPEGGERITASYTLTVLHNRTASDIPTVASGSFLMDLVQDENGLWYIQSWTDNAAGSSFTWSDIKATFLRD